MNNIFDIISEDLWIETLSLLNYQDLLRVCLSSKSFNNLCIKNNVKDKIKYTGFPRKTSHCNFIDLSEYDDYFKEIFDTNCPDYFNIDYNQYKILNMLYNSGYELIRGDLVVFHVYYDDDNINNNGMIIFDGCKLINFIHTERCWDINILPYEFTIINNNVPFDYWLSSQYKGIDNRKYVWFNIVDFRNELINNIKYEDKNNITHFEYKNNKYKLYFFNYILDNIRDNLSYILNTKNLILLNFDDDVFYEDIDEYHIVGVTDY